VSKPPSGLRRLDETANSGGDTDQENVMSNPPHTHPPAPLDPRRWKALALLCTAFFMVILDSAIVVVALPSIDADLAFSAGDLQWVLSAYLLSFGGLLLLGGRAADLLGRRRMFIVAPACSRWLHSAPDWRARATRCSRRAPRRAWQRRS
jgi:hypothetical protein